MSVEPGTSPAPGRGADDSVLAAIESLVGPLAVDAAGRLRLYADLLAGAARGLSLMSRRAEGEIGVHLVDSAAVLRVLDPPAVAAGAEVADLGSGAGLPGVVIAVLRPQVRVVAVDSRNSRVVFLKQVQRELGLTNLEIVHGRVESLAGKRAFRLAVCRALGSLADTLAPSLRLLSPGGQLVLYKGPRWREEEAEAVRIGLACGCVLGWVRRVELPGLARTTWFAEFHVEHRRPGGGCGGAGPD